MIIATVVVCVLAFVVHYKNWSKFEEGHFQVVSGIYKQRILLSDIDSVTMAPKLPEMERKNGFSWLAKEKGVFKDSLTDSKVYVFVDDLKQKKIRVVHHDSLKLYLNFSDSLETNAIYLRLKESLDNGME